MNIDIKDMCKTLRLAYVAEIFDSIPFENKEQYLKALFDKEFELREEARADRLLKKAKFLYSKELNTYQWGSHVHLPPHLEKEE